MVAQELTNGNFIKYLDERFKRVEDNLLALRELFDQRSATGDKALEVAKAGLNEMRGMAMDQQAAFLRRDEYGARHDALVNQMNSLTERVIAITAAAKGGDRTWNILSVAISLVIGVAAVVVVIAYHK